MTPHHLEPMSACIPDSFLLAPVALDLRTHHIRRGQNTAAGHLDLVGAKPADPLRMKRLLILERCSQVVLERTEDRAVSRVTRYPFHRRFEAFPSEPPPSLFDARPNQQGDRELRYVGRHRPSTSRSPYPLTSAISNPSNARSSTSVSHAADLGRDIGILR